MDLRPSVTVAAVIERGTVLAYNASRGESFNYVKSYEMQATAYNCPDNYGFTYSGQMVRKGIVAVDPSVIPLGTRLYVPNYGAGLAGDTGGAIRSRMIDMGYDDENLYENLHFWARWVDVYLLDPPPARSQIRWVLPNWPIE